MKIKEIVPEYFSPLQNRWFWIGMATGSLFGNWFLAPLAGRSYQQGLQVGVIAALLHFTAGFFFLAFGRYLRK